MGCTLLFLGLWIAFASEVSAIVTAPVVNFETLEEDTVRSLTFEKLRSGKKEFLSAGTDVLMRTKISGEVSGRFLGVVGDDAVLLVDGRNELSIESHHEG